MTTLPQRRFTLWRPSTRRSRRSRFGGLLLSLGVATSVACALLGAPSSACATAFIEAESPRATVSSITFPLLGVVAEKPLPARAIPDRVSGERIIRLQPAPRRKPAPRPVASAKQFARALAWAKRRRGTVSFAVIDARGKIRGYEFNRQYPSASVVKAMLLVAYLRQNPQPSSSMRSTLRSMIQYSDNDAATTVYRIVGDAGLNRVARSAKMTNFQPNGWWSLAQIAAADQARFFYTMDSQLPVRGRPFARDLLSHVITAQSWGVPQVARPLGWKAYFKGGWRGTPNGQLVHQASRLERGRQKLSIVVLTDGNPSQGYGIATVRGVAERLLR